MTSSRLPGKVLLEADGKPMLKHLTDRLKKVPSIDEIVLATTINSTDDALEEFAKNESISCFRGSEGDVMERVINVFPKLKFLETIIKFLNLHNIRIKYNVGQNIYIFKKS